MFPTRYMIQMRHTHNLQCVKCSQLTGERERQRGCPEHFHNKIFFFFLNLENLLSTLLVRVTYMSISCCCLTHATAGEKRGGGGWPCPRAVHKPQSRCGKWSQDEFSLPKQNVKYHIRFIKLPSLCHLCAHKLQHRCWPSAGPRPDGLVNSRSAPVKGRDISVNSAFG